MNALDKMLGTKTVVYLIPAYGRTYPDNLHMRKDWDNGKDFRISGGPYCSIRDLPKMRKDWDEIYLFNPGRKERVKL